MVTAIKVRPADPLTHASGSPSAWAIAAALEPLDKVASEAEAGWGVGALERLVTPETAARFGSARKKLEDAVEAGEWEEVAKRAAVMIRGWQALQKEAIAAGHAPGVVYHYWAVEAEDGAKFLFVQHERDMAMAVKKFPDHQVWAMREVVRVIGAHSLEAQFGSKVKDLFPGAVVERVDRPPRRAKDSLDDEIPF